MYTQSSLKNVGMKVAGMRRDAKEPGARKRTGQNIIKFILSSMVMCCASIKHASHLLCSWDALWHPYNTSQDVLLRARHRRWLSGSTARSVFLHIIVRFSYLLMADWLMIGFLFLARCCYITSLEYVEHKFQEILNIGSCIGSVGRAD